MKQKLKGERCSYILRLWRPSSRENWRVVLRSIDGSITQHFSAVEQLTAFLEKTEPQKEPPMKN